MHSASHMPWMKNLVTWSHTKDAGNCHIYEISWIMVSRKRNWILVELRYCFQRSFTLLDCATVSHVHLSHALLWCIRKTNKDIDPWSTKVAHEEILFVCFQTF